MQPVGRILILVEPVVGLDAGFIQNVILGFLHQVDHLFHAVRGEGVIAHGLHDVGAQVHVGHHVVEGTPGAGNRVVLAVVQRAQPFGFGEFGHQIRILIQILVNRNDRAHGRQRGHVLHVLHHVQQFKGLAIRQHHVQLGIIFAPRNADHFYLDIQSIGQQLFIHSSDAGIIFSGQHAGLNDANRVNRGGLGQAEGHAGEDHYQGQEQGCNFLHGYASFLFFAEPVRGNTME